MLIFDLQGEIRKAVIVKYNNSGDIVWEKTFSANPIYGLHSTVFNSVTVVADGFIAVGYGNSFGTGDWTGTTGKGGADAIVVKYNNSGTVVWKKNFGGNGNDSFSGITAVSDGFIAIGSSGSSSFGNRDWTGTMG
jgi:hypothetical protein